MYHFDDDAQVKMMLLLELCLVASGLGGGMGFLMRYGGFQRLVRIIIVYWCCFS
jgi:hypothetical protein